MIDGARTHDNRNHNPGLYQLSYAHHNLCIVTIGTPGRARTCNLRLRRLLLYPIELRAQITVATSGRPIQTLGFKERMVGAEGFEPPTLWSQTRCATRLRYAPTLS